MIQTVTHGLALQAAMAPAERSAAHGQALSSQQSPLVQACWHLAYHEEEVGQRPQDTVGFFLAFGFLPNLKIQRA